MQLTFHPVRMDTTYALETRGDTLVIDGTEFDFAPLPEGATLPRDAIASDWIAGDVTRADGVLRVSLILPNSADAPRAARHPAPLTVTEDGPVALPGQKD